MDRVVELKNLVETLRWVDDRLEMIDQRRLPHQFDYVSHASAAEVAASIRDMVIRGAPAIGVAAAYGVALEAWRLRDQPAETQRRALEAAFVVLAASRPTAVNLFWALERMRALYEAHPEADARAMAEQLLTEAHRVYQEDIQINQTLGQFGAELLHDGDRILTHCNAGALATAGHGTALGVIRSAVASGKRLAVFADETRPFLQGARLTAWELMQDQIPVTLITDNMSGHLMARGEIDGVIVGTDRVAANGDVANKIGTYMVAVLAHRHQIPFYVACPLSTIDLTITSGADIPIEERAPAEVTGYGEQVWAPTGVAVRNPSFDVTPAELVTGIITERGVIMRPDAAKIRQICLS